MNKHTHAPHQSTGTAALECLRGFDPGGNALTLSSRVTMMFPCDQSTYKFERKIPVEKRSFCWPTGFGFTRIVGLSTIKFRQH